jgi:hypothetical protein
MAGAIVIAIVLLILPVIMCMGGAALAAGLGWSVKNKVDEANEGSELLDLNR